MSGGGGGTPTHCVWERGVCRLGENLISAKTRAHLVNLRRAKKRLFE